MSNKVKFVLWRYEIQKFLNHKPVTYYGAYTLTQDGGYIEFVYNIVDVEITTNTIQLIERKSFNPGPM